VKATRSRVFRRFSATTRSLSPTRSPRVRDDARATGSSRWRSCTRHRAARRTRIPRTADR